MRMQDSANWESQEKSNGDINDQHEQLPQDERKAVQRRTFTRWMNAFLQRCNPPVEVHDLFTDIQDGRILMALLEELSGCKLLYRFRSSSHRIFRLNNISKALAFLDDRHVKLLGIDASGIADGVPSVILNLVWNIILHFQVKEVTRCLQRHMSCSISSLSMSSYPSSSDLLSQSSDIGSNSCNTLPSKGRKSARKPKYQGKAIKTLLLWVQRCTSKFGVEVYDFGKSWRSGLPFLALIKHVNQDLVDLRESLSKGPRENIQQAFTIAHHSLDIIPLLEPEDVACSSPDEQSIITYVSMFLRHCSGIYEDHTTDTEVPEIPNFGSPESVSLGEIHADNAEAAALLRGLEKSSEHLLWKQWSRKSSESLCATSLYTSGRLTSGISSSDSDTFSSCHDKSITEQSASGAAVSQLNKKKGRCRSILQPPSPLDAGVVSQEIRSWMEKGSDQTYSKARVDESHFSLSSEEGIYSLSALDSDEEDAYSYILDLNKEVSQPYNQLRRQEPSVKEETAEEMNEESKHCETCDILNGGGGYKPHEGSVVQNADFDLESEVESHSVVEGEFDLDKNESSFRDITHNRPVFDMEPEDESARKEREDRVRGQINDYGEEERETEVTEDVRLVTHGYDKTEAQLDEAGKAKIFEMDSWQKEVEGDTDNELFVHSVQMREKRATDKEEGEHLTVFEEGQERKLGKENDKEGNTEEGFGGGINKNILIDKIRGWGAARSPTEEDKDRKHSAHTVEDLTNIHKDEDMEENTGEVTNIMDFVAVEETDRGMKIKESKLGLTAKKPTTIDHLDETTPKNDTDGGVSICASNESWTSACTGTSHVFSSKGGFSLQSIAASCDITPLELEMLFVLWILLYCCLILPQMNL